MIFRTFIRMLLLWIPFWWVDVLEIEAGHVVTINRTLWRKGKESYHWGKIQVSIDELMKKPYCVVDSTIRLLYSEKDGAAVMTPVPTGIPEYLAEYATDRAAIRSTPYYDPDLGTIYLPSLDHRIVFRLLDRELVAGWFGGERFKKLMTLLMVSMLVIGGMAVGLAYVGSTPHIVRQCVNPYEPGTTVLLHNASQWVYFPCPLLTATVAHTNSTSVKTTSTSLYSTGAIG